MPTYVYKNLKTGKVFELEQRITEAVLKQDPKTGDPVERVIQAAGIVFKGGGFYKTDSRPSEKSGKAPDKSHGKFDAASSKADSGDSGPSGLSSSASGSEGSGSNASDSAKSTSGSADSGKASGAEKSAKPSSPAKSATKD